MTHTWYPLNDELLYKSARTGGFVCREHPILAGIGDISYAMKYRGECGCQWVIAKDARIYWLTHDKVARIADAEVVKVWSSGYDDHVLVLLSDGRYVFIEDDCNGDDPGVLCRGGAISPTIELLGLLSPQYFVARQEGVVGIYEFANEGSLRWTLGSFDTVQLSNYVIYGLRGPLLLKYKVSDEGELVTDARRLPANLVGKPLILGKILIDGADIYHYDHGYQLSYTLPSPVVEYRGERVMEDSNEYYHAVLCANGMLYFAEQKFYMLMASDVTLPSS